MRVGKRFSKARFTINYSAVVSQQNTVAAVNGDCERGRRCDMLIGRNKAARDAAYVIASSMGRTSPTSDNDR